jgi:hypothetical protein
MLFDELKQHLSMDHSKETVVEVGGEDESYLRGFHDGQHSRIDADDIDFGTHVHSTPNPEQP